MWLRARESGLHSVTGGNGAIYAVRREDYVVPDVPMGHDLFLPFTLVQRGRRAVYAPAARATEKMVPTIEGEWQRKRRMMTQAWRIVLRGGLLDLRAYPPLLRADDRQPPAAALRDAAAARGSPCLTGGRLDPAAPTPPCWPPRSRGRRERPLLIARYYVFTQASLAAGLYDHLRHGTPEHWEIAEGTR